MSDALNFLLKARPEAMGAYFRFLKGAGTHLDPKTRNLISVITKVHAQTENGLRQITRALREGATADEILDALLMAFPALGLAGSSGRARHPRHRPAAVRLDAGKSRRRSARRRAGDRGKAGKTHLPRL